MLRKLSQVTDFKSMVFAGFLSAGYFKADPRLALPEVDLTVVLALASITVGLYCAIRHGFRIGPPLLWIGALYAAMLIPLMWTEMSPYAAKKVGRLFSITLLAAVLPIVLLRTDQDLRKFLN